MAAAVALSQAGQKVLVLEQHYLPGGWCHSFDLEGYTFSPGVHYIGDLGPGGRLRSVYEGLGVADDLVFLELDPEGYDKVSIGDERFHIPKGKERLIEKLSAQYPHEARGIRKFIDLVAAVNQELLHRMRITGAVSALTLPLRCPNLVRYGLRPVKRVIDRFITDPVVKAILTIQGGDHGVPSDRCPLVLHAAVLGHYFEGGYYPKGGARALPKAFLKALRRNGGDIKVRAEVTRILTEGGRAIGVRLADGSEIRARHVVSNADPEMTINRLLGEAAPGALRRRADRAAYSISSLSLFLAAEGDPQELGLDSGNRWHSMTPDTDAIYRYAASADPLSAGPVPGAFVTCTTCKDPSKRKDGVATLEAFTFVSWDAFAPYADSDPENRPQGYVNLKHALAERMMERVEEMVPGLSSRIVFREIGTPLTNAFYTAGHRGNLYGLDKQLRQLGPFAFPTSAPVDGLYLCGASTTGHGVAGATYSGLAAARAILGVRNRELLTAQSQPLRVWPADHPEAWPSS